MKVEFVSYFFFFFFNDTATTEIYTLSLHDALPIYRLTEFESAGVYYAATENEARNTRSEEHTSELQSRSDLVCRLLLEKKKKYCSCFIILYKNYYSIYYDINFVCCCFFCFVFGFLFLFFLFFLCFFCFFFFFFWFGDHRDLHSFPTRRSSDLHPAGSAPPAHRAAAACRCSCSSGTARRCRSEEHTSELQSRSDLVCRLLLEKTQHPPPHTHHHITPHTPTPPL